MSDADKLRVLALWFDMWDRPDADRQRILDDSRNPGRNDVQRDLRRMAAEMDDARLGGWALAVLIVALVVVAIAWRR